MGKWFPISLTGGSVNTRAASVLEPGESNETSNVRLKPNDLDQLHRDKGNSTLASWANMIDMDYLNWENESPQLIRLTTFSTGELDLVDAQSGAFGALQSLTTSPTEFDAVHRGNEYFVGTDEANYVIYEGGSGPTFRDMGMTGIAEFDTTPNRVFAYSGTGTGTTSGTNWIADDVILYWWTEYDSTYAIESGPIFMQAHYFTPGDAAGSPLVRFPWIGDPLSSAVSQLNTSSDKVRLYRAYLGNKVDTTVAPTSGWGGTQYAFNLRDRLKDNDMSEFSLEIAGRGGLVDEIDWGEAGLDSVNGYTDGIDNNDLGRLDPPIPWPQIYINTGSVAALFEKLVKTRPFDVGTLWNDSLVVNDPDTSKQILRFSPPGQPEYQPDPYFMYFATPQSDEIVGMEQLNGRLIVLMTGSVWRVNYLPYEGYVANIAGKVQESITEVEGCVNRRAYAVIESEQGEVLVWVSPQGLRATNGQGWTDMCPDWSIEGAGIGSTSDIILHDNREMYRLELYMGYFRWDFYYHPSLLKDGKLRMLGPSTLNNRFTATASGELSGKNASWVASSSLVLRQNATTSENEMALQTGHLRAENPFRALEVESVGLTHSAAPNATCSITPTTKYEGEVSSSEAISLDLSQNESTANDPAGGGFNGNWLVLDLEIGGTGVVSAGPMWLKAETSEDGDG